MERVCRLQCSLADESVHSNFSLLLPSEDCVTQNLKDKSRPLGPREEVLLVVGAKELVHLVQPEGGGVVVWREVGDGLVHQVGNTERGEEASRPVLAGVWLSLREVSHSKALRGRSLPE